MWHAQVQGIKRPLQSYEVVEGKLIEPHPTCCAAVVHSLPGIMR